MTTIEERVEAGAKWLDANRPGWVDRINLETLDLGDPCRCVLGQEFPDYLDGAAAVRGDDWDEEKWYADDYDSSTDPVATSGFEHAVSRTAHSSQGMYVLVRQTEYEDLTQAWRDYITARRAAA